MEPERDRNLRALSLLDEPVRRRLFDWVLAQNRPLGPFNKLFDSARASLMAPIYFFNSDSAEGVVWK